MESANLEGGGNYLRDLLRLLDLAHRLQTVLDAGCFELYGLTLQQMLALDHIEANGEVTVSELADHLSRSNHTITSLLDRLEQQNLVVRHRDRQRDRRRVWVRTTELGRQKAVTFRNSSAELEEMVLGLLDPSSREDVRRAITHLYRLLG